jgi:hypothetical protein
MSPGAETSPGHRQEPASRAPRRLRPARPALAGGPAGPPVIKLGTVFFLNAQEGAVVPLD